MSNRILYYVLFLHYKICKMNDIIKLKKLVLSLEGKMKGFLKKIESGKEGTNVIHRISVRRNIVNNRKNKRNKTDKLCENQMIPNIL